MGIDLKSLIQEEVRKVIKELYDTKVDLDWKNVYGGTEATFEGPGGRTYFIGTSALSDQPDDGNKSYRMGKRASRAFPNSSTSFQKELYDANNLILDVDFGYTDIKDQFTGKAWDITGDAGLEAAKVFGIVINGLADYLKKIGSKGIVFTALEPSRRSLYKQLGKTVARKLGYVHGSTGDDFFHFVLHKDIVNQ